MGNNRTYWLMGLVGCALFGVGDWLLGFVDPRPVSEVFTVLKAGHGAGYALEKISWTLLLGALGVPPLMAGCLRMGELMTDQRHKAILRGAMLLLPVGWLLIHFTVSCGVYVYAWNQQQGEASLALPLAEDMTRMFRGAQLAAYLFAALPLLLLPAFVLRGRTILPRRSQLFTPILWMAAFSTVKFLVPATPFSNGIDTFCMNAGLMVWFFYLLLKGA